MRVSMASGTRARRACISMRFLVMLHPKCTQANACKLTGSAAKGNRKRLRQVAAALHRNSVQFQPAPQHAELVRQRRRGRPRVDARLLVGRQNEKPSPWAVCLEICAGSQAFTLQQWQDVATPA